MYRPAAEISIYTSPEWRLSKLHEYIVDGMPAARAWILSRFRDLNESFGTPQQMAAFVLKRVQNDVVYKPDPPGKEIFQSVEDTLLKGGDCEDLSELLVSALRTLGIRARIVWITQEGKDLNHVTAQVSFSPSWVPNAQAEWLWAEPSIRGAELGENPYAAAARLRDFQAVGGGGIPKSYKVIFPAGAVMRTQPAGALSQAQLDDIVQGIQAAARSDGQERLEGGLNGAVIGAARAAGAQLAGGLGVALPNAAQEVASRLPETARTAVQAVGPALVPAVREFGIQMQQFGPPFAQAMGKTFGQELGREINRGLPVFTQGLSNALVQATGTAGSSADRVATTVSNAMLAGAALLGGTIFVSVTAGVVVGVVASRKSRRAKAQTNA